MSSYAELFGKVTLLASLKVYAEILDGMFALSFSVSKTVTASIYTKRTANLRIMCWKVCIFRLVAHKIVLFAS